MRYILLSFFRALLIRRRYISSSRITCISVVSASVSLGQFYRYLVRIHHGTQNDFVQIPFHDDEEVKEKREESKTSASLNALNINVPSVSAARTNKSSSKLVFEGEKGVFMVCKLVQKSRLNFVRFENVFF